MNFIATPIWLDLLLQEQTTEKDTNSSPLALWKGHISSIFSTDFSLHFCYVP